ncbi:YkgJ family cysteine cluster protein [Dechloromonas sp. HYN0024]|uniref:YkgJ family cysteine cluster protein n=1 Tax=Dechloromonas sp. HYN0024 TaxID=2231055 RepID=UPI000E44F823|nr:YkgJ family cysteine cluster protein [Dechloromonas sp. HYN0024]AXS80425.1 hypothetical protein HYN24_10575 [Dechloromonas sp. HYN0024]
MTNSHTRRHLATELASAAAAYQVAQVIPHCPDCARPCCRLDALVLDLEWKQIKVFWKIEESRKTFDRRLSTGDGPVEIREAEGRYYVHSKPCPAYDLTAKSCQVYGQDIKPVGCSDFPVYEDSGDVIADLRCEAVDLDAVVDWIGRAIGPEWRVVQKADEDFPFLVTLSVRRGRTSPPSVRGRTGK